MTIRKAQYQVDFIINHINSGQSRAILGGDDVRISGVRMKSFAVNGITCVECGLVGKFFAKERMECDMSYHLNLYAIDERGKEVLMTRDHIIPKSKGGSETIHNMQTMCTRCNARKADKFPIKKK
jgi:5-methylcytosine-specific restriction endonuclease McrA